MIKSCKICFFFLLLGPMAWCQGGLQVNKISIIKKEASSLIKIKDPLPYFSVDLQKRKLESPKSILYQKSFLPKAFRYDDLALFCKIEYQLEKSVKFPIKFRLGEVQIVEQLEGKYR